MKTEFNVLLLILLIKFPQKKKEEKNLNLVT